MSRKLSKVTSAVLAAVLLALVSTDCSAHRRAAKYYFGTLGTDPAKAETEVANGITVAQMQIDWSQYEPQDGVWDPAYLGRVQDQMGIFDRAGMRIEVSLHLNDPPAWLLDAPGSRYVDQYGQPFPGLPNLVFSQWVREKAREYIARVAHDIGLSRFWAIRVGVDSDGEFSYPLATGGQGNVNAYWAFDEHAQAADSDPGRPPTVPPNPFPGWRPGERTYRGAPFSVASVRTWYDWYLAALTDAVDWQLRTYRGLGYPGALKVLLPGTGYYPADYRAAIDRYLDGTVAPGLMGLGVGFFKTLGYLHGRKNVYAVPTSLVDGSGNPRNNGCTQSDEAVDMFAVPDTAIRRWSSVRWVAAVARHNGFQLSGETAGPQVSPYYPGVMDDAARQLTTCGLLGLLWAFDSNLYDGTPGSSLQDYAAMIKRLR